MINIKFPGRSSNFLYHVHRNRYPIPPASLTYSRTCRNNFRLDSPWHFNIGRQWFLRNNHKRRSHPRRRTPRWLNQHQRSSTLNVNDTDEPGTCLTVTEYDGTISFKVGIAPETLRRTNLGELTVGSKVNLERAVAGHVRFGGHFVQVTLTGNGHLWR